MSAYDATRPWLSAIQPVTVAEFGSVARADLWAFDTMKRGPLTQTLPPTPGRSCKLVKIHSNKPLSGEG